MVVNRGLVVSVNSSKGSIERPMTATAAADALSNKLFIFIEMLHSSISQ
jgi:hypothetical protein